MWTPKSRYKALERAAYDAGFQAAAMQATTGLLRAIDAGMEFASDANAWHRNDLLVRRKDGRIFRIGNAAVLHAIPLTDPPHGD